MSELTDTLQALAELRLLEFRDAGNPDARIEDCPEHMAIVEIEKYEAKLAMIKRITFRLSYDMAYSRGEATDELDEVLDEMMHIGAWYREPRI